ncbi:SNARE-associated-like protein [Quillaja saponaria]|uniref:Biogenesis of lysosome-related organelles complex 1 subunit 7 n=1 Tax=Quillaja saponaria TaxID=32244 RepID=A0AAD7QI74_QUISA|nr:SNARE-associated-like protein [Quillaja saponaria]
MEASDNHFNSVEENERVVTEQMEASVSPAKDESESKSDHNGNSSEVLGEGLSSFLSTVILDFDSRAQETLRSQDQLSSTIDRLTGELDKLLEDAPLPFIIQHAAKISAVRKRVSSLNSLLKSIQGRIDNIDRMLSMGARHDKTSTESSV